MDATLTIRAIFTQVFLNHNIHNRNYHISWLKAGKGPRTLKIVTWLLSRPVVNQQFIVSAVTGETFELGGV